MSLRFRPPGGRLLAYEDSGGDGPAVLCLAGLTRDSRDFADLAAHLAGRYRVLRLDARGRGFSEWAADPVAEYTVPVEAGDAVAFLDHLGIARTATVGTSRGGLQGMVIAAGMPDRVSALVLNDIGPVLGQAGLDFILTYLGRPPGYAGFDEAARALCHSMGAAFPDLTPGDWLDFARSVYRDEGGRPALSYDPRLREAVEAALAAGTPDLWPLFEALADVPVLAIRGANSKILSAGTLEEMARRHPGMAQVTVANRGHAPFLDEPEALAAIDAFLERHAR